LSGESVLFRLLSIIMIYCTKIGPICLLYKPCDDSCIAHFVGGADDSYGSASPSVYTEVTHGYCRSVLSWKFINTMFSLSAILANNRAISAQYSMSKCRYLNADK
jgi:hypothetical protein